MWKGISDEDALVGRKEFGMVDRHFNRTGRLSPEKNFASQLMVAKCIPVRRTVLATLIADSRLRDAGKNLSRRFAPFRELARITSAPAIFDGQRSRWTN